MQEQHEHTLGKRTRTTPTRAGLVSEVFYICYYCPTELTQEQYEQTRA